MEKAHLDCWSIRLRIASCKRVGTVYVQSCVSDTTQSSGHTVNDQFRLVTKSDPWSKSQLGR